MPETQPTSEQIRFRSSKTGDHTLDTYIEAAEKGTRTLASMLGDLFNSDGTVNGNNWAFRTLSTGQLQVSVANGTWTNVADSFIFRTRGAYVNGNSYLRLDVVFHEDATYICTEAHTSSTATPDLTKFMLAVTSSEAASPNVSFVPAGTIEATTIQAAIEELDTENQAAHTTLQTNIDAKAAASVVIGPGTGLSGGGNLAANRTLSFDTAWGDARYRLNSASIAYSSLTGIPASFAPAAHQHNASDINAGTLAIARLPVATSGTSNTTQVVRADDTRLSNARTPTAHTHVIADVSGLQAALDSKVGSASPNLTGNPTINSQLIWTAGNDGATSGLDADLLDGVQPGATGLALLDDTTPSAALTTLGVTDFAKGILDDTSASDVRATIGAVGTVNPAFTGTLTFGDVNANLQLNAGVVYFVGDSGDYIAFDRASNTWRFDIGSSTKLQITASDVFANGIAVGPRPTASSGVGQFTSVVVDDNTYVMPAGTNYAYHLTAYTAGGELATTAGGVIAGGTTIFNSAPGVATIRGWVWRIA